MADRHLSFARRTTTGRPSRGRPSATSGSVALAEVAGEREGPASGRVSLLQRGIGNRATAALLQRKVEEVETSGNRPLFYSDVTGRFYATRSDAERDESAPLSSLYGTALVDESVEDDPNWDPQAIFASRMAAAAAGGRELTPLEALIAQWANVTERVETAAGTVTLRRGRGNQPYIQTRLADYGDFRVGLDYNSICSVLDARTPEQIERLAWRILRSMLGERVSFRSYDAGTRRAAAHLIAITQLAEEHEGRTVGTADYARAGVLAVADGMHTFTQVFHKGPATLFPAANSAQAQRDMAAGLTPTPSLVAGNMEWTLPPGSEK